MNHDQPLSPADREQLAQELLELHFGCHENPERLEARLAAEPALRALQLEVLRQARVLERAVLPEQPPLQLREPAPASRWRFLRSLRSPVARLATAAAIAAAALLVVFAAAGTASWRHTAWQREHVHLTVSAPRAVPAGAPWSFTVQTNDLAGSAVDCKVQWQALLADGTTLAASEVGTRNGAATVAMVADEKLRVPDRVVVEAVSSTDRVKQVLPLSTAEAGPLVHVSTDRPVYRPGEPVFVRVVVLDRVTRLPLAQQAQPIVAQLLDAKGAPVGNDACPATAGGVASFVLTVPAGSAGGEHRVQIASPSNAFPAADAEIVVRAFRPPQLEKQIVLDRASYAPGARGSAAVTAKRLAAGGTGATGASARGALVIDGTEVWSEKRVLGALGEVTFAFAIPKEVDKGAARFVATIDDGGVVETEVRPFVVPTGKVRTEFFPEGGELVAGVENGLYVELTDALGRPIDGAGELIDERGRHVETLRTQHQGRAKLTFVPKKGAEYRMRIAGQTEPVALPAVHENGVALRLLGDDVGATDPLRIAVAGRGDGPWLLGVFCRGVLVGQTTLRANENGELHERAEIALPPTAAGVLRTTVFDRNLRPIAERLVRRLATQRLDVALSAQSLKLNPGDAQQIRVRTSDETGAGRAAIVGIGVSDLAALSLGSEPPVGLVDDALLFADVERMEDLGDFFLGAKGSATNVDLLLGTRGWRRFVWRNDAAAQAAIAAHGPAAEGTLAREGFSQTPQVVSNLAAAQSEGNALESSVRSWERALRDVAGSASVLLLLLGLVEGIVHLVRLALHRSLQLQHYVAVATAVLGLFIAFGVLMPATLGSMDAALVMRRAALADDDFTVSPDGGVANLRPQAAPVTGWDDFYLGAGGVQRWGGYVMLGTNGWQTYWGELLHWKAQDPAANPLAGAFYNDGSDADVRARNDLLNSGNFAKADLPPQYRDMLLRYYEKLGHHPYGLGTGALDDRIELGYIQQWSERQYAHRHTPSDERRDFTPTICWNTLVVTDASGNAAVDFATSDAVTTWRVRADAHTATDVGRLGQSTLDFATQQPLQVEAKLPDEVSAGDRLQIAVNAVATDPAVTEVTVTAKLGAGLRLAEGSAMRIALRDGRGRALLPVDVENTVGVATIELEAHGGRFTDRVQHRVAIAPRGFPHRRSLGGSVEAGAPSTGTVAIPNDAVPGSGHVTIKVYPSPISVLTEGLAGILQEPHGCFEQASSSNYPNTLVLTLLDANGDDVPVVAARARALLPRGYAKITGYECKQKGYEWFGADPGHEALTAYGLLQFHDMAKVFDVDAAMVERTKGWLLARRDGKGNFVHQGNDGHSFGAHSQVLTNAYVVYALLQSGTPAADLKAELDALVARSTTSDPYELALITCAFELAKRSETASLRQRLASLQRADGALHGTTTSITCSGGVDLDVETTGFALLAWLPDPAFAGQVRKAIEFVQRCRSAQGTFGATQATIVALRALTAYATATRTMRSDGTLRIFEGERLLAGRAFSAKQTEALAFELWDKLSPGEHTLRFEVEGGGGPLPWACDVSYCAEQPADDPSAAIAIAATLRAKQATEGESVALDVAVTNTTDQEQPTPIAIVGLPASCELPTRVLEDLQKAGAFAAWELRGRELVLYWRTLAPRAEQKLTLDLVARIPGACVGPASRSYLYYTPAQKRWAAPVGLDVQPR